MFVSSLKLVYVACVVDAVIPAAAALEAEISEVLLHGPSHHLASNGQIATARDFLSPSPISLIVNQLFADMISSFIFFKSQRSNGEHADTKMRIC
jgi:hypothetical protein